jgi:hypothetical protein
MATGGITLVCEGELESLEISGVEKGPEGRRDGAVAAENVEVRRPHPGKLSLLRERVAGSAGDALSRLLAMSLPTRRHRTPLREICSLEWLLPRNYTAEGFVGPRQREKLWGRHGTCAAPWSDTTGRSEVLSEVSPTLHTPLRIRRSLRTPFNPWRAVRDANPGSAGSERDPRSKRQDLGYSG